MGSRDVTGRVTIWIPNMQFPIYSWSFKTIVLSLIVAEVLLCVKRLAKHIPIENALIPIFVLDGKIGGYRILHLYAYSRSLSSGGSTLGPGGHRPPKSCPAPPFLDTVVLLLVELIGSIVNFA